MNLGARPRGVGFPCATAGSVVSAQDAYYGDIVAERELTCGCQSLEKEFAFASTGAKSPWNARLSQTKTPFPQVKPHRAVIGVTPTIRGRPGIKPVSAPNPVSKAKLGTSQPHCLPVQRLSSCELTFP